MIIYGWNNRVIKEAPIEKVPCGHCGNENVRVKIVGHYAHIFWIPLFPYKKKGYFECDHCKHAVEDSSLVDQLKEMMTQLKKSVRFPRYMFSGSAIVIAFIAWMFVSSKMEDNRELEYISNPQVGDIYHYKDVEEPTEYKYTCWKAVETFGDSLYIIQNAFGYNMIPKKFEPEDAFVDYYFVVDKSSLQELYESGEIVKIQRDYSESTGFNRIMEYVPQDSTLVE